MSVINGNVQKEFFVWVNPNNFMVQHNLGFIGSFTGGPTNAGEDTPQHLQFIHNEKVGPGAMSPFHNNTISRYRVEYNLENHRHHYEKFRQLPSRLWALFLVDSIESADAYAKAHPEHVHGRVLKRCVTTGQHKYSMHDAAWVDFLQQARSDEETNWQCAEGYWTGARADREGEFTLMGEPWKPQSVIEVLYYGTVTFPNKDLSVSDRPAARV
jgi:hypothetical protein